MPVVVAELRSGLAPARFAVTGKISVDTTLDCFTLILIQ